MMHWEKTPQATIIASYGYDKVKHLLTIEFRDGSSYTFSKVLEHTHHEFSQSGDKDKYYHDHIEGKYPKGRSEGGPSTMSRG